MNETRVSTNDLERLRMRLEKLERQARRAKMLALLVILMAGASLSIAMAQTPATGGTAQAQAILPQPPPPPPPGTPGVQSKNHVLEGTELRLLDSLGQERLVVSGGEYPMVAFLDSRGRTRMRVGLTPYGPTIGFYDRRGKYTDLTAPHGILPLTE